MQKKKPNMFTVGCAQQAQLLSYQCMYLCPLYSILVLPSRIPMFAANSSTSPPVIQIAFCATAQRPASAPERLEDGGTSAMIMGSLVEEVPWSSYVGFDHNIYIYKVIIYIYIYMYVCIYTYIWL